MYRDSQMDTNDGSAPIGSNTTDEEEEGVQNQIIKRNKIEK